MNLFKINRSSFKKNSKSGIDRFLFGPNKINENIPNINKNGNRSQETNAFKLIKL